MNFRINNGGTLNVSQSYDDSSVYVAVHHEDGEIGFVIAPQDFMTMINWYKFQKDNGNSSLSF